jgi:hypothetical protein
MLKRSTEDLIQQLDEESQGTDLASIVVEFDEHTEHVLSTDSAKLAKLTDALLRGGEPIGIVCSFKKPDASQVIVHPFDEYLNEEWAYDYLNSAAAAIGRHFEPPAARTPSGKN